MHSCKYPITSQELYSLSLMQLKHTKDSLGASLCVLYLTSGHGLKVTNFESEFLPELEHLELVPELL